MLKTDIPIENMKVQKTTTMSSSFIIITSFLLFVIATTLFTLYRCQGGNSGGFIAALDEEVIPKNLYAVPAAAAARVKTLRGRKMVIHKATMVDKKAIINVMARGNHASFRRITLSGNKDVNFVAFTEDYRKPRHHPPKNN